MCIRHEPKLLKEWKPKKSFIAYKTIYRDNRSGTFEYSWTVGEHKVQVEALDEDEAGTGFYVFLDRKSAFSELDYIERLKTDDPKIKVIAVHVDPKDVVYAGYFDDDKRVFVCRRVTVKSLRALKGPKVVKKLNCPKRKQETEHKHLHDCAHGMPETHMAGSERYECVECGHWLSRDDADKQGLKYVLD